MREVLAVVHALAGDQNRITHSPVMSSEVRCQHLSRQHCGLIIHEFVNRETAMLSSVFLPIDLSKENGDVYITSSYKRLKSPVL